jgi:post-GPI attachment to proteins factor 3
MLCSTGDRLPIFTSCLGRCSAECESGSASLSPVLKMTLWTCEDDCKYNCMHFVTNMAIQENTQIHQFYGKWPFYRLFGIQEPASVLFSILNGIRHYRGAIKYFGRIGNKYPLRPLIMIYAFASVNTWVWSTIFHSRDMPFTEKVETY